ncbi:MAG: hypothetical protein CTY29_10205 [Methylobacter sp.]|nr:MAG: hypothetical protein CTY29_10205 [Methylobacter sp.]
MKIIAIPLLTGLAGVSAPALAHTGTGAIHGLMDGLLHPMLGPDHWLVMLAIGVWAALQGGRAVWLLPLSFLTAMSAGAGLYSAGISIASAETWVAVSLLLVGLLLRAPALLPPAAAMGLAAVFAVGHGYVHAAELTGASNLPAYAAGFLLTTAGLHGLGIVLGRLGQTRFKWLNAAFSGVCVLTGAGLLAAG